MVFVEQVNMDFPIDPSWHGVMLCDNLFILPALWYQREPDDLMMQCELLPDMIYDSLLWKCEQSYIDLKEKNVIAVYRRGKGRDNKNVLLRDVKRISSIVVQRSDPSEKFPEYLIFSGVKFELPKDNHYYEMNNVQMQVTRYIPVAE